MILRENMYFEPRIIGGTGLISWFGEKYWDEELLKHTEETVYIRDNGENLFIYGLESDEIAEVEKIEAVFTLICKIKKSSDRYCYGRKIR